MGGNRSETVGCDVCARCGAVIVAVPTADGERRCARCGGSDFFASTVDVDAPLFERDCYQLARCAECVNMWSAVRQYGRAPSALVLCPFLRGRAGIRLAPLVVAGAMADEECPFRRPASCVGDAELSELAMMGNSAAADELRLRGLPARCPLCGSVPTVERSTTGLAVGGRLALLSVRCGCGFEVCERMPFELFEAGEGVARAHMLDRALAKWNARRRGAVVGENRAHVEGAYGRIAVADKRRKEEPWRKRSCRSSCCRESFRSASDGRF